MRVVIFMGGELQRGGGRGEHTACGAAPRLGFVRDARNEDGAAPQAADAWLGILMLYERRHTLARESNPT